MNAFYRKFSYVISLCFMVGIIAIIYYLFIFPQRIIELTQLIDYTQVEELWPAMSELYLIVGSILGLGVIALIMNLLKKNEGEGSNVVYIEKFKEKKKSKTETGEDAQEKVESALEEKIIAETQGITDKKILAEKALSLICNEIEACQAALYLSDKKDSKNIISLHASYAFVLPESQQLTYEFGEGLAGQVAKEKKMVYISDIPDGYIKILSGLGTSSPNFLLIVPLVHGDALVGVAEIASFTMMKKKTQQHIQETMNWLAEQLGKSEKKKKQEEPK